MSSAMELIIVSACLGLSGNAKEACQKTIEASAKQTGIEQKINKAQYKVENKANKQVNRLFDKETVDVMGSTVFLAKTVSDKSVKFNVPNMGICDKITSEVGPNKYYLNTVWSFK